MNNTFFEILAKPKQPKKVTEKKMCLKVPFLFARCDIQPKLVGSFCFVISVGKAPTSTCCLQCAPLLLPSLLLLFFYFGWFASSVFDTHSALWNLIHLQQRPETFNIVRAFRANVIKISVFWINYVYLIENQNKFRELNKFERC